MYLGGNPNNVIEFHKLKKKYNFFLIEDSCHALGSEYKNKGKYVKIGSCVHSDISTFSLHPVKSITSGEGGFLTTNSKSLAKKFKILRSHGIKRTSNKKKYWNYDVIFPSFNFRMSDINASLAYSQIKKLHKFVQRRNYIASVYRKKFHNFSKNISIVDVNNKLVSSYHLLIFLINFKNLLINKDKFIQKLNQLNIYPQYHYIPIYKFSYYKHLKRNHNFKSSERYYKNSLSMPIFYQLSTKNLMKVIKSVKFILLNFQKQNVKK